MDALTTWTLAVVIGGPWVVGVVVMVVAFSRYLDRLDREEPLYDPVLDNLKRGLDKS